jgi:hypothetical protein
MKMINGSFCNFSIATYMCSHAHSKMLKTALENWKTLKNPQINPPNN